MSDRQLVAWPRRRCRYTLTYAATRVGATSIMRLPSYEPGMAGCMLEWIRRSLHRHRKWWASDSAVAFLCGGVASLSIAVALMAWGPFSVGFGMLGVAAAQFVAPGIARCAHGHGLPTEQLTTDSRVDRRPKLSLAPPNLLLHVKAGVHGSAAVGNATCRDWNGRGR